MGFLSVFPWTEVCFPIKDLVILKISKGSTSDNMKVQLLINAIQMFKGLQDR